MNAMMLRVSMSGRWMQAEYGAVEPWIDMRLFISFSMSLRRRFLDKMPCYSITVAW